MRKTLIAVLCTASLVGMPVLVGCDRELSHEEKTTTDSKGNQTHSEQTTVQHPDGSVTTEKQTENQSSHGSANNNP